MVETGEERVPRRRAAARRRVGIREPHALGDEPVDVRRGNPASLQGPALEGWRLEDVLPALRDRGMPARTA
jgi:hypothetical protein